MLFSEWRDCSCRPIGMPLCLWSRACAIEILLLKACLDVKCICVNTWQWNQIVLQCHGNGAAKSKKKDRSQCIFWIIPTAFRVPLAGRIGMPVLALIIFLCNGNLLVHNLFWMHGSTCEYLTMTWDCLAEDGHGGARSKGQADNFPFIFWIKCLFLSSTWPARSAFEVMPVPLGCSRPRPVWLYANMCEDLAMTPNCLAQHRHAGPKTEKKLLSLPVLSEQNDCYSRPIGMPTLPLKACICYWNPFSESFSGCMQIRAVT